jgi:DNA-binding transcriptional regulator YiaG
MEQPLDIKAARAALNMSQTKLADAIGVDQGSVSAWENDRHKPSKAARKAIEKLLAERARSE